MHPSLRTVIVALILGSLGSCALLGASFSVTNTADSGAGSLRQAIAAAASNPGADTITFSGALNAQSILLSLEIPIDDTGGVTIDATSLAGGLNIGNGVFGSHRLLSVGTGSIVTLRGVTLANSGGSSFFGNGGAILNQGTLALERCILTGNSTGGNYFGGAISNSGTLTLMQCTLSGNTAGGGGAIYTTGTLALTQCTLSGNSATTSVGGGAIRGSGTLTLCTLTGNIAGATGGAISVTGTLTLRHCTVAENSAGSSGGGGVYVSTGAILVLENSIVAGNTIYTGSGMDISVFGGTVNASRRNIVQTAISGGTVNGSTTIIAAKPRLAPLADNGGPTKTMALLCGSPAIDAAFDLNPPLATDQRGFSRNRDGDPRPPLDSPNSPDIGAYEAQVQPIAIGFNFQGAGGAVLSATEIAGVPRFAQSAWNNLAANYDGTGTGVPSNGPKSIGSPAAVTLNLKLWWKASATGGLALAPDTSDKRLMSGFLDSDGSGEGSAATNLYASTVSQPFFSVAGLPAELIRGGYKVLVYADGDGTDNRVASYWLASNAGRNPTNVSGETALTPHVYLRDAANFTGIFTRATGTSDAGANTPAGNYVQFDGRTESAFTVRAEEHSLRAPINAVQIVRNEIVVVTTTADELDPIGTLGAGISLREALRDAPDGAGILFDASLNGATIRLNSEIVISKNVVVDASDLSRGLTITDTGDVNYRLFTVLPKINVAICGITFADGGTGMEGPSNTGGAILNKGTLVLTRCTFIGNSNNSDGGAIHNRANLTCTHCTFAGNRGRYGGAISCNTDEGPKLTLSHCTFSGNSAERGGAIIASFSPPITLNYCIVSGNSATLIGPDIYRQGPILTNGVNFIGDLSGSGMVASPGVLTGQALLAPLGMYGGSTQTMALLAGSPARNAAIGSSIGSDQRGFPIVGVPDLGAYEADNLGNFNAWAMETKGTVLAFTTDTDSDGSVNGVEYATRGDPFASDASPVPALVPGTGSNVVLAFRYRAAARDLRYIVQRRDDPWLTTGRWVECFRYDSSTGEITEGSVTSSVDPATEIIIVTDTKGTGAQRFWRLKIEQVQ